MITRKYLVVSAFFVVAISITLAVLATYFHIMLPASNILVSDADARAYLLNEKYVLLVWHNQPFIIYPKDQWVGSPSDYRNTFMGKVIWPRTSALVFWPRGSYSSVPLNDAVKRDGRDSYEFSNKKLQIRSYFFPSNTKAYEITLQLP